MKPRNPKKRTQRARRRTISPRPVSFINNDHLAPPGHPGEEFDIIKLNPLDVWWKIYPKLKPPAKSLWIIRGEEKIINTLIKYRKKATKQQLNDLHIIEKTMDILKND